MSCWRTGDIGSGVLGLARIALISEVELFHLSRAQGGEIYRPAFQGVKDAKTKLHLPLKSCEDHRRIIARNMASGHQ